jgi:hypothetical protein
MTPTLPIINRLHDVTQFLSPPNGNPGASRNDGRRCTRYRCEVNPVEVQHL